MGETPYPRDASVVIPLVIDQSQQTRGIRGRRKSMGGAPNTWSFPCWPRTDPGAVGPAVIGNPPTAVDTTMDAWLSCVVGTTTYYVPAWTD